MKITQKIAITIAVLVPISIVSYIVSSIFGFFTEEPHYKFQIVNRTPYQLDSIFVNTADDRNFSLAPNEATEEFSFYHDQNFANLFAEAQLSVFVLQYTSADSTYKNSIGNCIGFSSLKEDELNRIVITLGERQPHDTVDQFWSRLERPKTIAEKERKGPFARLINNRKD